MIPILLRDGCQNQFWCKFLWPTAQFLNILAGYLASLFGSSASQHRPTQHTSKLSPVHIRKPLDLADQAQHLKARYRHGFEQRAEGPAHQGTPYLSDPLGSITVQATRAQSSLPFSVFETPACALFCPVLITAKVTACDPWRCSQQRHQQVSLPNSPSITLHVKSSWQSSRLLCRLL